MAAFEIHVQECPPCIHYIETYKVSVELGKRCVCEDQATSGGIPEGLVKAILSARKVQG